MAWRAARSLLTLRDQVNRQFPGRNKSADGLIGDAAHRARRSLHNPDPEGVVAALDLTHDLRVGFDTWALGDHLRIQRDRRIDHVISNKRIFSSTTRPWVWRPYTAPGSNPHSHHIHIGVRKPYRDDPADWVLKWSGTPGPSGEPDLVRPVLRLNSRGDAVKDAQQALEIAIDGIFGPVTDAAVRAFQLEQQITVDGIIGPVTWERLGVTAELD